MGSIPLWVRLTSASTTAIGLARLALGAGLSYAFFRQRMKLRAAFRDHGRWLVLLGACFAAHWYTYFEAIKRTSPTLGLLSLSTFGIHVTWMSVLFGTRRATRIEWSGVLLAALGAVVIAPDIDAPAEMFEGFLIGMTSAVFYGAVPHVHQKIGHVEHWTRSFSQLGVAFLCFLPAAASVSFDLAPNDWLILGALGVLCTFVAHNVWISISTQVAPSTSGVLYYMTIPVTVLLEWAVLGQPPRADQIAGALLIASGTLLGPLWRRLRPEESAAK